MVELAGVVLEITEVKFGGDLLPIGYFDLPGVAHSTFRQLHSYFSPDRNWLFRKRGNYLADRQQDWRSAVCHWSTTLTPALTNINGT